MAVQHEIKSQLAKLLATEDLVVEHKQVETASFNVETRVLILPLWEKASNSVYDLLVGHEVGHALFTPNDDWFLKTEVPHGIVNVCEDARIEKLMKRKYMGLAKTFYYGYSDLNDDDFFNLEDEEVDTFNLADRINLYFKIGNFIDLHFTERETEIRELVGQSETFDEVLAASKVLHEYCKEEQENKKKVADIDTLQLPMGGLPDQFDTQESGEQGEEEENDEVTHGSSSPKVEGGEGSDKSGDMTEQPTVGQSDRGGEKNEIEVKTVESLSENIQDLVSQTSAYENVYCEIPDIELDKVIASNSDVHEEIERFYAEEVRRLDIEKEHNGFEKCSNWFAREDEAFYTFKKDARKEVSYLVKEFECKKSASAYARAAIARTGVLDTTKLHTYKYSEDLFKKVTILPDGKNHGLVFLLDWSGSMQYVMKDTLKQLFNLIWFCKKVQIPFEVYAFTNEWTSNQEYSTYGGSGHHGKFYTPKTNMIAIDDQFSLMNLFTSNVNGKTLEKQMINVWRVVDSYTNWGGMNYPRKLALSGTPLNEALITFKKLLPEFQKRTKVEKVQCVVLTDGEAGPLSHHVEIQRDWEDHPYMGTRRCIPEVTFIRDRKIGRTYKIGYNYSDFTDSLLENLQDTLPTVNFIGIRILAARDGMRFARHYNTDLNELRIMEKDWKKSKSYIIKNSGYDAYIVMSSNHLNQDSEFEVKEDATKSQIKSAFAKSLKTKKLNKKVLGEFISLVV